MAKAAAAKAKPRKAASSKPPGRSWFWLQGMVCGAAAAAAPGTALMVCVLLAPGLGAYVTEQAPGRPVTRTMLLMGVASVMMPLRLLWEHGGSLAASLDLLADPGCPLLSWSASGAGWFAGQLTEILTRLALDGRASRAARALNQERDQLAAEWLDGSP